MKSTLNWTSRYPIYEPLEILQLNYAKVELTELIHIGSVTCR